MTYQNHIFQAQNAIYKTIKEKTIHANPVLNRGNVVSYPYTIITSTKKTILENLQIGVVCEIEVQSQSTSVLPASNILQEIEESLTYANVRDNLNFYTLHLCEVKSSTVFVNEEGYLCGKLCVNVVME